MKSSVRNKKEDNMMKKIICTILAVGFITFCSCAQSNKSSNGNTAMESKINVTVNGITKTATLENNSSTQALIELLKKGNVTVHTDDYGSFEKVGSFGSSLPQNNTQINTVPGDIILYLGTNICFYYGNNNWNFTRLGKLDITDVNDIKDFLNAGNGNTDIVLSLVQ